MYKWPRDKKNTMHSDTNVKGNWSDSSKFMTIWFRTQFLVLSLYITLHILGLVDFNKIV